MTTRIPDGITADHVLRALQLIDAGVPHAFADSTGYDVVYMGRRYAPKAVVGVAAEILSGVPLGPYAFKGGKGSKCFRLLREAGFAVVSKGNVDPFPGEVSEPHLEGLSQIVVVNRYERDPRAREKCIVHYGATCQVCDLDFATMYGEIGDGFIHVHHLVPLSDIGNEYVVCPIRDLRPVCPNCHAMLHKKSPPFSIEELRLRIRRDR